MGNTSSNKRDRSSSSDTDCPPSSPCKDDKVFEFGSVSRKGKFLYQPSLEEGDDFGVASEKSDDAKTCSSTISADASTNEKFIPTVFKWDGGGKEVFISGTFSDWKAIPMVKSKGDFALIVEVPEGDHQYKFQVDGQWFHDPTEPTVDNDMGTQNNVISVKKSDFEVFEALAVDSIRSGSGGAAYLGSPPGSYAQEVPKWQPYEMSSSPPNLPPHLLQVILNKDVSLSCEPTLLPEPNHVMLNHLYALSIQDGVMVLSATHRYKKKYVTTLLYKPIKN